MRASTLNLCVVAVFLLFASVNSRSKSRFTNLKCEAYDEKFTYFKSCKLRMIGRGVVGIDIWIVLKFLPVDNVFIHWSMYRRYNGFKPFLFNVSCDFCQLLNHPNKVSFESLVLGAIRTASNLNHSCPITHDVIIKDLVFNDVFLKSLPLPQGDYKLQLRFGTNKQWKFVVEVYFLRDE